MKNNENIKKTNNSKKNIYLLYIMTIIIIIFVAIIKYKNYEVNYYNSDATWHTLLTIEAYNETPISKHLFLPIVSLGGNTDKNIPWGDTIPDKDGNYYYTSFSPAGYFLPWLFFKIFNLPISESSIYIISALLLVKIITFLYRKNRNVYLIAIVGLLVYISAPEILHGLGITYWHHSIMQVTLLIQLYYYLKSKQDNSKIAKYVFYGFTLINPYIEWTGYVANIGFALSEFFINFKKDKKQSLIIILLTIISFILFCMHYLLVVDANLFFKTLKKRFLERGVTTNTPITSLITGYITSFKYIWLALIILIIFDLIKNRQIKLENKLVIFLCLFPVLENIIMKQHATVYSYDRMKMIFPLVFIMCELTCHIIENSKLKKIAASTIMLMIFFVLVLNTKNYINDTHYIWQTNYRTNNEKLAEYIKNNYENCILAIKDSGVRGYINLLFKRGIYELETLDNLKNIAKMNNEKYLVMLFLKEYEHGNVCNLGGATIYDIENNTEEKIIIKDGIIEQVN